MTVPDATHPGWLKAISGHGKYEFEFLATKLIMGRLNVNYSKDPSPANAKKCATELQVYFTKYVEHPKAQNDLTKILGGK